MPNRVLKLGGTQLERLAELSTYLHEQREGWTVIVHGGGRELSRVRQQLGIEAHAMLERRATTHREMDMTTMVLCGLVNTRIVAHLVDDGHRVLGLSGVDLGCMRSAFINEAQLGRVGGPPRVDPEPLLWLLEAGVVLVVAPICMGHDGGQVKVDGDDVAQSLAVALDAKLLEFAGDTDALRGGEGPIDRLSASEVDQLVASPDVRGTMVPKLHATMAALEGGVAGVRIGSLDSLTHGGATVVSPT